MHLSTTILLCIIFSLGVSAGECHRFRAHLIFGQISVSKECSAHDFLHNCQLQSAEGKSKVSTAWVHPSILPITEGGSHGGVPLVCKVKVSHSGLQKISPLCAAKARRYRNYLQWSSPMTASALSPLPIPKVRLGDSDLWVPEIGFSASSWGDPRQGYGYDYTDPMLEQVSIPALYVRGLRGNTQYPSALAGIPRADRWGNHLGGRLPSGRRLRNRDARRQQQQQ